MIDDITDMSASKKRKLIVGSIDPKASAGHVAELKQKFDLEVVRELSQIRGILGDGDNLRVLLFYPSPIDALCQAMSVGIEPSEALAAWHGEAQEVLTLNRRDRRRTKLIEIGMAQMYLTEFRAYFGLLAPLEPETVKQLQPDDIFVLMAQHVLTGSPPVRRIYAELQAASLDFSTGQVTATGDVDAAFRVYADLRKTSQEAELLRMQTRAAQEAMEVLSKRRLELERTLAVARSEVELFQEQTRLMEAQQHDFGERLQILQKQQRELDAQRQEIEWKDAEIRRILNSKSFRMTAPFRRLRALFPRRG